MGFAGKGSISVIVQTVLAAALMFLSMFAKPTDGVETFSITQVPEKILEYHTEMAVESETVEGLGDEVVPDGPMTNIAVKTGSVTDDKSDMEEGIHTGNNGAAPAESTMKLPKTGGLYFNLAITSLAFLPICGAILLFMKKKEQYKAGLEIQKHLF